MFLAIVLLLDVFSSIYAQILADLDAASTNIPSSDQKYIANKAAVNALKAKVNATKPSPDWNQVIQNCDKVIAEGYTLLSTYDQLFDGNEQSAVNWLCAPAFGLGGIRPIDAIKTRDGKEAAICLMRQLLYGICP